MVVCHEIIFNVLWLKKRKNAVLANVNSTAAEQLCSTRAVRSNSSPRWSFYSLIWKHNSSWKYAPKKKNFLHPAAANKRKDTAITQQVLVDLHAVTQKCPAKGERAKCSESIFSSRRAECWRDGPVVEEKNYERNINPEEFGFSFGNWFPNCWSSNPSQMWNVLLKNNTKKKLLTAVLLSCFFAASVHFSNW